MNTSTQSISTESISTDSPRSIWTHPIHFIGSGFGVGTLPIMPGTFATLLAIPIYLAMSRLPLWGYTLILIAFACLGVYACGALNRAMGTDDHPAAAWDEVVGYLVAMFAMPPQWYWIVGGFILFRVFDIAKPGPIGWLDRRIHGGLGVILDDVAAGVATVVILQLCRWFFVH